MYNYEKFLLKIFFFLLIYILYFNLFSSDYITSVKCHTYYIKLKARYDFALKIYVKRGIKCQKISKLINVICADNAGYFVSTGYKHIIKLVKD